MLPQLDANGNLPPGIHVSTVAEVLKRFGKPGRGRLLRTESLRAFIDQVRHSVMGLYIDGSYTTTELAPNDVDVAPVLPQDFEFVEANTARLHLIKARFRALDIHWRKARTAELQSLIDFWSEDRDGRPKGIVFVELQG